MMENVFSKMIFWYLYKVGIEAESGGIIEG